MRKKQVSILASRLLIRLRKENERLQARVASLEEAVRFYSRTVEQNPTSILMADANGRIQYANPRFEEITGYRFAEIRNRKFRPVCAGCAPAAMKRELWKTVESGRVWRGEFCNRKKSGEHYCEAVTVAPVKNEQGDITHFVAIKEDISERKRAERAFRESEQRFSDFMEHLPILAFIKDERSRLLFVNKHMKERLGEEGWLGQTSPKHVPDSVLRRIIGNDRQVLKSGRPSTFEEEFPLKTGETRLFESTKFVLKREGSSPLLGAVGFDITHRKQEEQLLKDTADSLLTLFDNVQEALLMYDVKGRLQYANQSARMLLGMSRTSKAAHGFQELLKRWPAMRERGTLWAKTWAGESQVFHTAMSRPGGDLFEAVVYLKLIRLLSQDTLFCTIRDITGELLLASDKRVLQEKQALMRNLHDGLGGLLAGIRILAESSLLRKEESGPHSDTLQRLAALSREANMEMRNLLNLLERDYPTWSELAADLRRYGLQMLEGHGVDFRLDLQGDGAREIPGVHLAMTLLRIFQEALNNIVKHARARRARARLCVRKNDVSLVVEDDGVGMSGKSRPGRGLGNMRRRAAEIGGRLEIGRAGRGRGVCVRLQAPLSKTVGRGVRSRLNNQDGT